MENLIEGGAFEVPDPENSFTAPFFLVEDEHGLKNYVDDPGNAPEEDPSHRLREEHFYQSSFSFILTCLRVSTFLR